MPEELTPEMIELGLSYDRNGWVASEPEPKEEPDD